MNQASMIRTCAFQSAPTLSCLIQFYSNKVLLIAKTLKIISKLTLKWSLCFHGNSRYSAVLLQHVKPLCSERFFFTEEIFSYININLQQAFALFLNLYDVTELWATEFYHQ